MHSEMTRRQELAWVFAAVSAPVVMRCANLPWQWVLAACAFAALYYIIICILRLLHGGERSLTELAQEAFGNVGGRVLLLLSAAWTLLAAAKAAEGSALAFPNGREAGLSGIVLLALAALAGRKGTAATARCAAVLAPILAAMYALFLAAAAPQLHTPWCAPWGTPKAGFAALEAMLLPSAVLFLRRRPSEKRVPGAMLLTLVLAPPTFALMTSGCLSPQVTAQEPLAFYTLGKSLHLFSFMQRFEPLVSTMLYVGLFCMTALLTQSGCAMLRPLTGKNAEPWLAPAFCAAAFVLSFVTSRLPARIFDVCPAVFWGILPILTLLVVYLKKVRKKAKKGVDKPESL